MKLDDVTTVASLWEVGAVSDAEYNGSKQVDDLYSPRLLYSASEELWVLERIVWLLNVFGVPAIIVFGVAGNLLAFAIFTHTYLRIQSASVYLAFLNATNSVFLVCLFVTWLQNHVGVTTIGRPGWCQAISYLSQVSNFLSVWSVVGFTVERWLIVFYPLRKEEFCRRPRALTVVSLLTLGALLLYAYTIWTNEVIELSPRPLCVPSVLHRFMVEVARSVDTVFTLIIPSTTIVTLNVGIVIKVVQFSRASRQIVAFMSLADGVHHQSQTSGSSSQRVQDYKAMYMGASDGDNKTLSTRTRFMLQPSHIAAGGAGTAWADYMQLMPLRHVEGASGAGGRGQSTRRPGYGRASYSAIAASFNRRTTDTHSGQQNMARTRQSYQMRTTRTLLTISTIFVALNLPSHVFRIHAFINYLQDPSRWMVPSKQSLLCQQVFQVMFYVNFAANFVLYCACSRNFRQATRRLVRMRLTKLRLFYTCLHKNVR